MTVFRGNKWEGLSLSPSYFQVKRWCDDVALAVVSFRHASSEKGDFLSLSDFARVIRISKPTLLRLEHLSPESAVPQKRVFEILAQYAESKGRHDAAALFREGIALTRERKRTLWGRNERRSYESGIF